MVDYLPSRVTNVTIVDAYEALLKKAYSNLTEPTESTERFTVPEAKVYIEGKTTVLENFAEIADGVRRDKDHLMKYLLGELGTAGKIDGNRAVFNGKFEPTLINGLVKSYVEDYVICSECGKPDTRLVKDDRFLLLRCDACGGHRPVKKRKAKNYNALHESDRQLGRLVEALTAAGLLNSSLLVVMGENGEAFHENGAVSHAGTPVEPAVHVALVLPGVVDTPMIENVDQREVLTGWPVMLNMPVEWVALATILATRFRLREISVPPAAATLEVLAALSPTVSDTLISWINAAGRAINRATSSERAPRQRTARPRSRPRSRG